MPTLLQIHMREISSGIAPIARPSNANFRDTGISIVCGDVSMSRRRKPIAVTSSEARPTGSTPTMKLASGSPYRTA